MAFLIQLLRGFASSLINGAKYATNRKNIEKTSMRQIDLWLDEVIREARRVGIEVPEKFGNDSKYAVPGTIERAGFVDAERSSKDPKPEVFTQLFRLDEDSARKSNCIF